MRNDRRVFTKSLTAGVAGVWVTSDRWTSLGLVPAVAAAQTVALKDVVPKGWLIGVAINQNQSDGRDAVAVELVSRQFNAITPENLLKFQSLHPEADRFTFDA